MCEQSIPHLTDVVTDLGSDIGPRNISHYAAFGAAADYVERKLPEIGYRLVRQSYEARQRRFQQSLQNGRAAVIQLTSLWLGHTTTLTKFPGSNDNGSAVAALLELARLHLHCPAHSTV